MTIRRYSEITKLGPLGLYFYLAILTMTSAAISGRADSQELDKVTQQIYLDNLGDTDFIEANSQHDVFLREMDSSATVRLTDTPMEEKSPSLSQDRRDLVFCTSGGGLYILNIDSQEYRQLVPDEYECEESQWVPLRGAISFVGTTFGTGSALRNRDVYTIDKSGGNLRNITNSTDINEFGHDWSPDGKQFSSVVRGTGKGGLCQIWLQSGAEFESRSRAAEIPNFVAKTAWSFDEERIYYSFEVSEFVHSLAYIDIASRQAFLTPITDIYYDEWDVSGVESRFTYKEREAHEAVGIDTVFSTNLMISGSSPRWGNDGRCVVFLSKELPANFIDDVVRGEQPKNYNMIVVKKDGTVEHKIDWLDSQSPIVTELQDETKQKFSGEYKNLTRLEAAALLETNKSLQEFRVDYFDWDDE